MTEGMAEALRKASTRHDALDMFREGASPSACDRRCGLVPGTTHDEVVLWWAADREAHGRGGR